MAATSGSLSEIGTASARSSLQLFLRHSSSTVIMAVTTVVVGRLLGPENYGIYTLTLTLTVPALLILVSDLGISSALVRFTAKTNSEHGPEEAAHIARIGVLFKVIVSVFISFSVFLFSPRALLRTKSPLRECSGSRSSTLRLWWFRQQLHLSYSPRN